MAENKPATQDSTSDEIDLGQLFRLIGRGFDNLFQWFLRVFIYLRKNILKLIGLVAIGLAIGYGLNRISSKKLKTEVIVKPNLESKNYLYNAVEEIQANIKAEDTLFFSNIGVDITGLEGLEVTIAPVKNEEQRDSKEELSYLEILQKFENNALVSDIIRQELLNTSSFNDKITFFYKDNEKGQVFAEKVMQYINSNAYYNHLTNISLENAKERIEQDKNLINQVDGIINNYTKSLEQQQSVGNEKIILENQEQMNIAELFQYKNALIRDIESKRLELEEESQTIKVINFGKPQQVQKAFYGKNLVLIPTLFMLLFFMISFIKYLNNKANQIK